MPAAKTSAARDVALSKALSWILRHGAVKEGLNMSVAGFVDVEDILRHNNFKKYTLSDIRRVVAENDKQRFCLQENLERGGKLQIRANQGHSLCIPAEDEHLEAVLSAAQAPCVVHGTYFRCWEKIKAEGLSRMSRRHVHFAPGDGDVLLSGVRKSAEIHIYVDVGKALADGIKFYRSANNVILSPGDEDGFIKTNYFEKVVDVKKNSEIDLGLHIGKV